MKYALLIYQIADKKRRAPDVDEKAALAGHRTLLADASANGHLHSVARLGRPATARAVRLSNGVHESTDGPFAETKEWLIGFYLLECADEDQALARARLICTDASHVIEVRPVTWMKCA